MAISSVDLGLRQAPQGRQVVGETDARQALLCVRLLELLAGDHDGHRGFGDEIVGEGAEEDAVRTCTVSKG